MRRVIKLVNSNSSKLHANASRTFSNFTYPHNEQELSKFGKSLFCNSLFTGKNLTKSTEQMYGDWAENYENDMGALKFDSLKTMPQKVEQYLTETLTNNMLIDTDNNDNNLINIDNNSENDNNNNDVTDTSLLSDDNIVNIADVGCGTGLLGELLLENTNIISSTNEDNINIDGMDLTKEMLDILEKERGDLYNELYQHDMAEKPWPLDSDKYDVSVCNGVLVYVKDNGECLDEFIRITKKGGHCLLMLRHDMLNQFSEKIYQLLTDKKWELQEITKTRYNFKTKDQYFVPYNHHIFQVL